MISFLPSSPGNAQTTVATFRILRTISSSQHNHSMIREEVDLINWIKEIHDKMYKNLVSTFLPSPPPPQYPLTSTKMGRELHIPQVRLPTALHHQPLWRNVYCADDQCDIDSILAGMDTYIRLAENVCLVDRATVSTRSTFYIRRWQ